MPRRGRRKGFEEVSPQQWVQSFPILLDNSNKSTSNATNHSTNYSTLQTPIPFVMTSRFDNAPAREFLETIEYHFQTNQTRLLVQPKGVHDFCVLHSAQHAVVGHARSTFLQWASFLGRARRVIWYSIDSIDTRRALGDDAIRYYSWNHPHLKDRIHFVTYQVVVPLNETNVSQ